MLHDSSLSTEKQREHKNTSSRTKSPIVGMRGLLITAGPFAIAPISRKHLCCLVSIRRRKTDGKLPQRFQPKKKQLLLCGRNMCNRHTGTGVDTNHGCLSVWEIVSQHQGAPGLEYLAFMSSVFISDTTVSDLDVPIQQT